MMPDDRDPKYTTPDEWNSTENVVYTRQNVTIPDRQLPNSPDHYPGRERRDFPEFSPEQALAVIRALIAIIDRHGWQGEDHLAYEQAQDVLARG